MAFSARAALSDFGGEEAFNAYHTARVRAFSRAVEEATMMFTSTRQA
jgi:hypothetical protein